MIDRLAIGLLYFNKALPQFEQSLRRMVDVLRQSSTVKHLQMPTTDGLAVDMARNQIVSMALQGNANAIIWLDTDMIYPDDALVRLVNHANQGHAIVAGLYRRTRHPYQLLCELEWQHFAEPEDVRAAVNGTGLAKVAMAAGGYSIVNTEVYRKVPVPWYCNWDFVSNRGGVGEDRFFVLRANEAGYHVMVDPSLTAIHCGRSFVPVDMRHGNQESDS